MMRDTFAAAAVWCYCLLRVVVRTNGAKYYYPLVKRATDVLLDNYVEDLEATTPSKVIHPHQDSTTSVLSAQAWAHVDQQRAQSELLSIFLGQWENGMVPTLRYAPGYSGDFLGGSMLPGPGGWGQRTTTPPVSASGANTSALAALPLHAEATLRIFNMSPRDSGARLWLQELFPALFRYHEYLHKHRKDPETGLLYVYHPWETEVALDSAAWPAILGDTKERMANESWSPPQIPEEVASIPGFPGNDTFEAAMFLVECAAGQDYDDRSIRQNCPFLLQDVQFNAVLLRSDKALLELAGILEATRSGWQSKVYSGEQYEKLKGWAMNAESGTAMAHMWSSADGAFLSRYTPVASSKAFLMRPATSSAFSGLIAPGLPLSNSFAAVRILLTPGELTFRCGEHPVPDLECGYNFSTISLGKGRNGISSDDDELRVPSSQGGGAQGGAGDASAESPNGRGVLPPGMKQGTPAEYGGGSSIGAMSVEGATLPVYATAEAGRLASQSDRKIQLLHNLLAKRGFEKQGLLGLTSWLANSTLALLAPPLSTVAESLVAPSPMSHTPLSSEATGGESDADRWFIGGGALSETPSFLFYQTFDADSGLALPDAEGNCSSIAAAASVLLLLGDGPEGGNDFPPITHATLFVVMAIELAFSLTVGVSCLVFSLNLVRKLREEDPDSIRPGYRSGGTSRGSSSGYYYSTSAMHGDAVVGPGVVRAAGVGTGRDTVGKSGTEYMRGGGGGGGGGSGGTSVAVMGRGIGSILTRNSNSQMEMYDSEEELEYTFPRQDNGRSGRQGDWRIEPDEEGESSDPSEERGLYHSDDDTLNGEQRLLGRPSPPPDDTRRQHYTLPADNSAVSWAGGSGAGAELDGALTSSSSRSPAGRSSQRQERGEMKSSRSQEIPPRRTSTSPRADVVPSSSSIPVEASGAGNGRDSESLFDVLRPFYASLKFW